MGETMTKGTGQGMPMHEGVLLAALRRRDLGRDEISRMIKDLQPDERFVMPEQWRSVALDKTREDWRRLIACDLLISRCITYPCKPADFIREAVSPFGLDERAMIDMAVAQHLPFERREGESVYMVNLPVSTPIGPAALYIGLGQSSQRVERAVVYPKPEI